MDTRRRVRVTAPNIPGTKRKSPNLTARSLSTGLMAQRLIGDASMSKHRWRSWG
jgi:hypothetical protein